LAPIPNPAPPLTEGEKLGAYVSKIEKVAAAVRAKSRISSMFNERLGMTKAAIATIIPSNKSLRTLLQVQRHQTYLY